MDARPDSVAIVRAAAHLLPDTAAREHLAERSSVHFTLSTGQRRGQEAYTQPGQAELEEVSAQ